MVTMGLLVAIVTMSSSFIKRLFDGTRVRSSYSSIERGTAIFVPRAPDTPEIADAPVRPKGRPGRKPKGSVPVVIPETPDKPDPDHVLTWRQRKVLQVIRDSVQKRGYPPSMRES